MITFRPHRLFLEDAMREKKTFETLQELVEYIVTKHNETNPYFQICTDELSIRLYNHDGDKRVGWKDLFIIDFESYNRIKDKNGYKKYFGGSIHNPNHPCGVIGFFTTAVPDEVEDKNDDD